MKPARNRDSFRDAAVTSTRTCAGFARTEIFADTYSINWFLLFVIIQNISTLLSDKRFFFLTLEGVRLSVLPIRTWGTGLLYHGE